LRLAVTSNGHRAGHGREVRFEDAIITIAEFRRIALSMPEASEGAHMGHPDFRMKGKIFATLFWRDEDWGMVKLKPEQQRRFVAANPGVFEPVKGGWGRRGATQVRLDGGSARESHLFRA
jgi:hypothetical protein